MTSSLRRRLKYYMAAHQEFVWRGSQPAAEQEEIEARWLKIKERFEKFLHEMENNLAAYRRGAS